jgi:hypothetical protein
MEALGFARTSEDGTPVSTADGGGRPEVVMHLVSEAVNGMPPSTLSAAPTAPVSEGLFGFDASAVFQGAQPSQPTYSLDFPDSGSIPGSLGYTVPAADLTTVHSQVYASPSGNGSSSTLSVSFPVFQPWAGSRTQEGEPGRWPGSFFTDSVQMAPGSRTDYLYSSAPRLSVMVPGFIHGGSYYYYYYWHTWGAPREIRPGGNLTEVWNKGPMVPSPAASPLLGLFGYLPPGLTLLYGGQPLPLACPACRQDDNGWLQLSPFGDSDPAHYGDAAGSYNQNGLATPTPVAFYRDGKLAVGPLTATSPYDMYLPLLTGAASYQLDWTMTRGGDPAASTRTDWAFRSAPGTAGGSPPADEECEPDTSRGCSFLPLLFLNYDLNLNYQSQATADAPLQVAFTVSHQDGQAPPAGVSATVSASFDDGQTWTAALRATALGGDTFAVAIGQPAAAGTDGFASLRVTASDGTGNSVTQTIIRAYGLTG